MVLSVMTTAVRGRMDHKAHSSHHVTGFLATDLFFFFYRLGLFFLALRTNNCTLYPELCFVIIFFLFSPDFFVLYGGAVTFLL